MKCSRITEIIKESRLHDAVYKCDESGMQDVEIALESLYETIPIYDRGITWESAQNLADEGLYLPFSC